MVLELITLADHLIHADARVVGRCLVEQCLALQLVLLDQQPEKIIIISKIGLIHSKIHWQMKEEERKRKKKSRQIVQTQFTILPFNRLSTHVILAFLLAELPLSILVDPPQLVD